MLLLGFVLGEVLVSAVVPIHPEGWFVRGPSDDLYYVPAPGLSYAIGGSKFEHSQFGSPLGPSKERAAKGRPRVVFVGDSVCYGFFASGEANLCARTEAALAEQPPPTGAPECLNFGVPGYNTHMVRAALEEALRFESVRAVVYVFHENDLTNATFAGGYLHRPALFRERYDMPAPFWQRQVRKSRLMSWAIMRLPPPRPAPRGAAKEPDDPARAKAPYELPAPARARHALLLDEGRHRDHFRAHLKAMAERCRALELPFALLFVPCEETLRGDPERRYASALEREARAAGVPFLKGQAAFAAAPEGEALYGDPGHPNAAGHALLSALVQGWLRGVLK